MQSGYWFECIRILCDRNRLTQIIPRSFVIEHARGVLFPQSEWDKTFLGPACCPESLALQQNRDVERAVVVCTAAGEASAQSHVLYWIDGRTQGQRSFPPIPHPHRALKLKTSKGEA